MFLRHCFCLPTHMMVSAPSQSRQQFLHPSFVHLARLRSSCEHAAIFSAYPPGRRSAPRAGARPRRYVHCASTQVAGACSSVLWSARTCLHVALNRLTPWSARTFRHPLVRRALPRPLGPSDTDATRPNTRVPCSPAWAGQLVPDSAAFDSLRSHGTPTDNYRPAPPAPPAQRTQASQQAQGGSLEIRRLKMVRSSAACLLLWRLPCPGACGSDAGRPATHSRRIARAVERNAALRGPLNRNALSRDRSPRI